MNAFSYITEVEKVCQACGYTLIHRKIDADINQANARRYAIVRAFDWCPFCSQMLVTKRYSYDAIAKEMSTVVEEIQS